MKTKLLEALTNLPSIVKRKILLVAAIGVAVTLLFSILWIRNLFINGINAPLLIPILIGIAIVVTSYYDLLSAENEGYIKIYGFSNTDIGLDYAFGGRRKVKERTFTLIPERAEIVRNGIAEEAGEEITKPIAVQISSFVPSKKDGIILYIPHKAAAYKDFRGNLRYEKIYGYLPEEEELETEENGES